MNAKDAMLAELKARNPSRSLGQKFYTDPDFYRLDLETIFYRDWLFAGHDCEIPAPGDYFTLQIGDYPIIVLRGRRRVDTRAAQFLPASRFAHMRRPEGRGEAPRMSLSSVDLRSGRRIDPHAPHGRGDRQDRSLGSSPSIAKALAVISSCASRRLRRVSSPSGRRRTDICRRTRSPTPRSPSRARSLKTAIGSSSGKTTASATTARQTIRNSAGHSLKSRRYPASMALLTIRRSTTHWDRCEAAGLPSIFLLSEIGTVPHQPRSAPGRSGQLHDDRPRRRRPAAQRQRD